MRSDPVLPMAARSLGRRSSACEEGDAVSPGGRPVTCAYWNTRGLNAGLSGDVTGECLDWLAGQVELCRPTVIFLMEVQGGLTGARALRKWWRRRGYDMVFLPGTSRNAIVCAIDKREARFARHVRVAPRVLGVILRVRGVRNDVRLACMHGVQDPHIFQRQWADGEQWATRGAGLICGDLNHVPCSSWRSRPRALDVADRALRVTLGFVCDCCPASEVVNAELPTLLLVPAPRNLAQGLWTHYLTSKGRWGDPNARYDFAARAPEAPAWKGVTSVPAESVRDDGVGRPLSDHLWQVVAATLDGGCELRQRRMLAPNFGGVAGTALLREVTQELADGSDAAGQVDDAAHAARLAGRPAADAVVGAVLRALRRAQWRMRVTRKDARARAGRATGSPASPKCLFATWRARLRQACAARRVGFPASSARHLACLHPMTGMHKYITGGGDGWQLIIRRCRHEANRAARALHIQDDMRDAWTGSMAKRAQRLQCSSPEDAQQLLRIAAAICRGPRASVAFEEFHVDDDPTARTVHAMDQEAGVVAADIGRRCVRALDGGSVPAAYQALTDKYSGIWPRLDSRHGGSFALKRDLSFEDFEAVLANLKSKAVGKSGFAMRLIKAAGPRVQRALYDALINDVGLRTLSARWHEVILVLLPKPPPNRADIVRECREIALMEHDVKALLLLVRRECYSRVIGRVSKIQPGWVPGYGCDNQGVASAFVTDSEHRLRRPLWMLYVDLSQFFPRIARECLTIAEIAKGLPPEIVWLAGAIYGTHCPDDPNVARCQYDSAGGLCDSFDYHVGVLMGNPLSTDQARIFLDCIVCAISAAARGVRLWGSKRVVTQLLCADDWLGVFNDVAHLRIAWGWWRLWEPMAGAKLGMSSKGERAADKTIVTGIAYDEKGRPRDIVDPRLQTVDGRYVPARPRSHAYKHLGRWRRADASRADGQKQFEKRVRGGLRLLQRLRHPTPHTFLLISEAILGGYAGFYLQDLYLTFREADALEAKWRAIFNRMTQRHSSTPRADIYETQFRAGSSRRHIWSHGLRATHASVNAMLADGEDLEHRAAARAGVALSLYIWGCRQDPRTWDWCHLRDAIEAHLAGTKHRYVGDVWLLAWATLLSTGFVDGDAELATQAALQEHWRWSAQPLDGDPLSPLAPHFATPTTPLVFQMQGAPILTPLLFAGYVAAGHYSWRATAQSDSWQFMSFDRAAARDSRLRAMPAGKASWDTMCGFLARALPSPPAAETRTQASDFCGGLATLPSAEEWKARLLGERPTSTRATVDAKALLRLGDELEAARRGGNKRECEHWRRQLDAVQASPPPRLTEWAHGVPTSESLGSGAHVVFELDRDVTRSVGGHRRWRAQGKDEGGRLLGWEGRLAGFLDQYALDDEGYLTSHRVRVEVATFVTLPPVLQLLARARLALASAPVVDQPADFKARETRVNLAAAHASFEHACRIQAQYDITHAFTVDGTKIERAAKDGSTFTVVARAAVAHTGQVTGGRLKHDDPLLGEFGTTYLAEKAAVNDALATLPQGARAMIWLDATSPAHAQRSFMRATARRKQQMYAAGWHAATAKLLQPLELVLMHWQTSHVGEPMNEWADVEAVGMAQGEVVLPIVEPINPHVSMVFPSGVGGPRRWADVRADKAVADRLRACSVNSVFRKPHDLVVTGISSHDCRLQAAIRSRRCLPTDLGRPCTPYQRLRRGTLLCPWCGSAAPDWTHFCFECEGAECCVLRGDIVGKLQHLQECNDQTLGDAFVDTALTLEWMQLKRHVQSASARPWADCVRRHVGTRIAGPQRIVGGLFGFDSPPSEACKAAVLGASRDILRLLHFTVDECGSAWGEELRVTRLVERVWGRFAVRLKMLVVEGGPSRAAALRACEAFRCRLPCLEDGALAVDPMCQARCLAIWASTRRSCPPRSAFDPSFAARAALDVARTLVKVTAAARARAPTHQPRVEAAAAATRNLDSSKERLAAALEGARRARLRWRIAAWTLHAWHRARRRLSRTDVAPLLINEQALESLCGQTLRPAVALDERRFFHAHIAACFNACWRLRRHGSHRASVKPCLYANQRIANQRWLAGDTVHGGAPRDDAGCEPRVIEFAPQVRRACRGSKKRALQTSNARVMRGWQADSRGAWGGACIADTRRRDTRGLAIDALVRWPGTWEVREGAWAQTASTGTFEVWLGVNATNFPDRLMREEAWSAYHNRLAGEGVDETEERELQRLERRALAQGAEDEVMDTEVTELQPPFERRALDQEAEGEGMDVEESVVEARDSRSCALSPALAQAGGSAEEAPRKAIPVATFIVWLRFLRGGHEALRVALSDSPPPCTHLSAESESSLLPGGVWFAEAGEELERCLGGGAEGRRHLEKYPHVYALPQDSLRAVIRIEDIDQFDSFVATFGDPQGGVDWGGVAAHGVGGVFISVLLQERRHVKWYAGWEAGTGLMLHRACANHIATRDNDGAYVLSDLVPVEARPPACLPQRAVTDAARLADFLTFASPYAQDTLRTAVRARAMAHLHFCRMHADCGAPPAACATAARELRVTSAAVDILSRPGDTIRDLRAATIELGLPRCPACDAQLGHALMCPACVRGALGIDDGQSVCALDIFCAEPTTRHLNNLVQEVNVRGDGSCWLYSLMALGGEAPHAFSASGLPRCGSWRPSAAVRLAGLSEQERNLERGMRQAVRTWMGVNGGAKRFYRAESAIAAAVRMEDMAEGSPSLGANDGVHGGSSEYTALADLLGCVLFSFEADNDIGTRFEPGCPGSKVGGRGKQRRSTLSAAIEYAFMTGHRFACMRYIPTLIHWRPLIPTCDDGRATFCPHLQEKLSPLVL